MLGGFLYKGVETFVDGGNQGGFKLWLTIILTLLIYVLIITLVGKFLWNNILVRTVTIVKPIYSIWQLLGLVLLFHILYPNSVFIGDNNMNMMRK